MIEKIEAPVQSKILLDKVLLVGTRYAIVAFLDQHVSRHNGILIVLVILVGVTEHSRSLDSRC
jgi:hypothetical protein